jgi:hypothetical protein
VEEKEREKVNEREMNEGRDGGQEESDSHSYSAIARSV